MWRSKVGQKEISEEQALKELHPVEVAGETGSIFEVSGEGLEDTNKIAFRHRDDLGRIEDELKKFNYTPAELEYILEPKGAKGIPGFAFKDIERQKEYINFLAAQRSPSAGHADAQENRRDQDTEHQIG